jgi:hypothetical protein
MRPPVLRIRENFFGIFLAGSDDSITQAHADFFSRRPTPLSIFLGAFSSFIPRNPK